MSGLQDETIKIMKQFNIRANKNLGQNFLINQEVLDNIIDKSEIIEDDMVIEIGPGLGTLTNELLKRLERLYV